MMAMTTSNSTRVMAVRFMGVSSPGSLQHKRMQGGRSMKKGFKGVENVQPIMPHG